MKKTYITPQTEATRLFAENALLTGSLRIDASKNAEQWSQKKDGWNSESWTEDVEE